MPRLHGCIPAHGANQHVSPPFFTASQMPPCPALFYGNQSHPDADDPFLVFSKPAMAILRLRKSHHGALLSLAALQLAATLLVDLCPACFFCRTRRLLAHPKLPLAPPGAASLTFTTATTASQDAVLHRRLSTEEPTTGVTEVNSFRLRASTLHAPCAATAPTCASLHSCPPTLELRPRRARL